jgi:hypothetical protein
MFKTGTIMEKQAMHRMEAGSGNRGEVILYEDDDIRESLLYSNATARRYMMVMKNRVWQKSEIRAGIDLSLTNYMASNDMFDTGEYGIIKNVLSFCIMNLPPALSTHFGDAGTSARVKITEFIIKKEDTAFSYAIVTEIYSPTMHEPRINEADEKLVKLPSMALLRLYFSKEEPWAFAGHDLCLTDRRLHYPVLVEAVKEKLHNILWDALPMLLLY